MTRFRHAALLLTTLAGISACGDDATSTRGAALEPRTVSLAQGEASEPLRLTLGTSPPRALTWSVTGGRDDLLVAIAPTEWAAGTTQGTVRIAADWAAEPTSTTLTLRSSEGHEVALAVDVTPRTLDVRIDRTLAPDRALDPLPGAATERPRARLASDGQTIDFARDELFVSYRTDAERQAIDVWVRAIDGEVALEIPAARDTEVRQLVVTLDPGRAVVADAAERVGALLLAARPAAGDLVISDALALDTLRLAAERLGEQRGDIHIALNVVFNPLWFIDGESREAPADPSAGWTGNLFDVAYFREDGPLPIGVGPAWQALEAAGRLTVSAKIAVLDGGFNKNPDFGEEDLCNDWGDSNGSGCGEGECPWHGQAVALAAAGRADNGYGAAGTGGPVADLLMYDTSYDQVSVAYYLSQAALDGADIVNMSFHVCLPIIIDWSLLPLEAQTLAMSASYLLLAAAGNAGEDVDKERCVFDDWGCTELWWYAPCENFGVDCIGGVNADSTTRHPSSNWGSDGSLDLMAPFSMFIAPTDDVVGIDVRWSSGTSYSTPFVAGVAALVMAADPELGAPEAFAILRETALASAQPEIPGTVSAAAAVRKALGNVAPYLEIVSPEADAEYYETELATELTFSAEVFDANEGADCCTITWSTDEGRTDEGRTVALAFDAVGAHTVTVTATDESLQSTTRSITIEKLAGQPSVSIAAPSSQAQLTLGAPVWLRGTATDPNYTLAFPCGLMTWSIDAVALPTRACDVAWTPTTAGPATITLRVDDPSDGLSDASSINVTVAPAVSGTPPVVWIAAPLPGIRIDDIRVDLAGGAIEPDGQPIAQWRWSLVRGAQKVTVGTTSDVAQADLWAALPCTDPRCDYTLELAATSPNGTGVATIPVYALTIH